SFLYRPSHLYTAPGTFAVKMKAYNSDNCVDSVYQEVLVNALPKPLFRFVSTVCKDTIKFFDSTQVAGAGTTIASWNWNFGDPVSGPNNTSILKNPVHYYATPGIYHVTLVIANSASCVDSITRTVQRFPCIQAIYSRKDTLCARYKIAFTDNSLTSSSIATRHWSWDDGTLDTNYTGHIVPIYHTFADSGTYHVKLRISDLVDGTIVSDSLTTAVKIHPTPLTYFSNPPVCLNQISLFRDTSKTWGEKNTRWSWTFTPKTTDTSTFKNPGHKFDTAGIYSVKLIVMNKYGCKDSLTKPTRVYGLPVAHFDNTVACEGNPTYFTDKSIASDTTIGFWRWFFHYPTVMKDSSRIKDPNHQYDSAGLYSVRMIVRDHFGCIDTIDSAVRVNITPVSSFTVEDGYDGKQGQIKLNNRTPGDNTYSWEFGNGKSSSEKNPIATFTDDGTYIVKLISLNQFDCSDTTSYEYRLLFKGLYVPNAFAPSSTNLGIRLFQPVGINLKTYHVTVFDSWGHLMWESSKLDLDKGIPLEGWDGTFEGNMMPQGNYMWRISATFVDESPWNGSDNGVGGSGKTMGTVTLIR
ncbi:MAG: PKD domain-containing protein, partial [Bacteroidota bacterium]